MLLLYYVFIYADKVKLKYSIYSNKEESVQIGSKMAFTIIIKYSKPILHCNIKNKYVGELMNGYLYFYLILELHTF